MPFVTFVLQCTSQRQRQNSEEGAMKFIPKVLIALALTQAEGFSASRLTMLEPSLMNGMRRATSLLSPSVARYSTSILRSDISGRFSSQLPSSMLRSSARLFSSNTSEHDTVPLGRQNIGGQIYGITTHDALFKYVLSDDNIRPSFFHAFIPGLTITSSKRLDEHMNPIQDLQLLREFIHRKDTTKTVKKISSTSDVCLGSVHPNTSRFSKDDKATIFLHEMVGHFDDIKKAFPRAKYDGTMDFVCRLENGEYALVEMQVFPKDYWDKRALAYVAAFYGNQLRKGADWPDIRKVIGINILGGGTQEEVHWSDTPDQYIRHYKFQEQLHKGTPKRYIDGIELIQYSVMNAPDTPPLSDQEKQDWIAFFKRGARMNEAQVKAQIQTPAVLEAFDRATLSKLPSYVREAYDAENIQYARVSQYTAAEVAKGEKKAILKVALGMKKLQIPNDKIVIATGLSPAEVDGAGEDDQES